MIPNDVIVVSLDDPLDSFDFAGGWNFSSIDTSSIFQLKILVPPRNRRNYLETPVSWGGEINWEDQKTPRGG